MKKYLLLILLLIPCTLFAQSSTMTDQQVLEYAKQGLASGKSQKDIAMELTAKGVDRAQAARVKQLYEKEMGGKTGLQQVQDAAAAKREHTPNGEDSDEVDQQLTAEIETGAVVDAIAAPAAADEVFGRNVFRNRNLSFAPSANSPTPKNYILGAGDEVIVDVFGANQSTIRSVISPEGYINIDVLGPVFLAGKTIDAANVYLKNKLSSIYEGLNTGAEEVTDIQLSLGQIRSIQVSIIGEVLTPGTYMVSSLSTVFHAMFRSGGVEEPGTVRAIKLVRNNRTIATIDMYDFLMNGSRKNDVRLEEGDVILVEPYEKLVKIEGYVKRPMNFEMKGNETVGDLLKYAGGFSRLAYTGNVSVVRQVDKDFKVSVVDASQFGSFVLQNGDKVTVKKLEARYENRISISGSVYLPGVYELNGEVNSVRKLVSMAGGLQPEAYLDRALIHRQNPDLTFETFAVDLGSILNGTKPDVPLKNNDALFVHSSLEITDIGTLTINGDVVAPGTFPFSANTTIKDLILQASGLLRSASSVRVDVARMIIDKSSMVAQKEIATYYSFSIENGLSLDGADEFILEPYDVVTVRRSPSYVPNRVVSVVGEVNFPGEYNMSKREERVVDLLQKAGNLTDFAYVKGARLFRKYTEEELAQKQRASLALSAVGDTTKLNRTAETAYLVSFDLEDAIANPDGDNNLVLQEGDVLDLPVYSNIVRIDGAVQMPSSIAYRKGLTKSNLIDAAGGYLKHAYKKRAFVIYMNGRVTKLGKFTKIEPGCQVYVPMKDKTPTQTLEKVMSISSSLASLAMMGVSIANLLK